MNEPINETGDITKSRHRGSAASVKANPSPLRKNTDNAAILAIFKRVFQTTAKDVADEMQKPLHCVSGRFTWLLKQGLIVDTGNLAPNRCRLLRITQKGLKA